MNIISLQRSPKILRLSVPPPRVAILLALCGYTIVIISLVASFSCGNGEWFMRSGSVPTSIGALIALRFKKDQKIGLILVIVGTPIWGYGDIVASFLGSLCS